MAAGLGFKDFTTGEVLTASDVDGYLMQGIWVFASAAARDAAVTSPQEGNFAFTKDTNGLWYYDGAAWVASGATGDIEGVTAGIGISGGGTSGTVTVTNSMATAIDAKGDLVVGTGADTFSKLTVGANGTILTADSAEATGLKWAAASGGAGNMTQIATGTLSGASVQITGLTSYTDILVLVYGTTNNSTDDAFVIRLNSDTSGNKHNTFGARWTTAWNNGGIFLAQADIQIAAEAVLRTSSSNVFAFKLTNCKNAGFTDIDIMSEYLRPGSTAGAYFAKGIFTKSEAISTIDMKNPGGTWSAGTYTVWGA